MSNHRDDWTRYVDLSEFEALLGPGEGPLIAPGRIGRRHGRHWRCVRARGGGNAWTPWRWLWRRRVERLQCLATITAAPDADPATLAALARLVERVVELDTEELTELAEEGP
ncbi:MAG TPA: hypothetical protein PKD53_16715 [Chloroflexaceae bacterium]|nr:hypothetical protein [Chloroflexaceae bacterium]